MSYPLFLRRQVGPVVICPLRNGQWFAHCETCGEGCMSTHATYVEHEFARQHSTTAGGCNR